MSLFHLPNASISNLFTFAIPYALNTHRHFTLPFTPFSLERIGSWKHSWWVQGDHGLHSLSNNTLQSYSRERLDSLWWIDIVSTNQPHEGMNLRNYCWTIGKWRFSENSIKFTSFHSSICLMINSYTRWSYGLDLVAVASMNLKKRKVLPRRFEKFSLQSFYNGTIILFVNFRLRQGNSSMLLMAAWLFWRWGFEPKHKGDVPQGKMKFVKKSQMEFKDIWPENIPTASIIDIDGYWHHIAIECFAISIQLGIPIYLFTFTINPHWPECQAFKRDDEIFADSAITSGIKFTVLTKFIQKNKTLGNVSTLYG
jgi:hypothetical protein